MLNSAQKRATAYAAIAKVVIDYISLLQKGIDPQTVIAAIEAAKKERFEVRPGKIAKTKQNANRAR